MWNKILIDTNRGSFEVFTCGTGEPLCITHLYSEFNERGYYFADQFVQYFRVYLVNLKEAGCSSKAHLSEELSMKETILDLEEIRKELDIKWWGFAGHSTGGMLGLVYAASFPESLTKLIVGGAAASKDYMEHSGSIYSKNNRLNARLRELLAILKSNESTKEERIKAGREWTEMSLFNTGKFDEYFSKPSSGRVVPVRLDYYSYNELPNYDIRKDIKNIETPTIVYCGRYDAQCPIDFSIEINTLIANSKLYVFEESNHVPYLEEEISFKAMVIDFHRMNWW